MPFSDRNLHFYQIRKKMAKRELFTLIEIALAHFIQLVWHTQYNTKQNFMSSAKKILIKNKAT